MLKTKTAVARRTVSDSFPVVVQGRQEHNRHRRSRQPSDGYRNRSTGWCLKSVVRRIGLSAAVWALSAATAGGCDPRYKSPAAPVCPRVLAAGDHNFTFSYAGTTREYIIHMPRARQREKPLPLVLHFHGLGSNMQEQVLDSGFNTAADRFGFVVAYPNGLPNRSGFRSWNGGLCCVFDDPGRDDVGFVRALVTRIGQKTCIDRKRIYAAGMSNGGHLAYRLACEASDLIAAVGPVCGTLLVAKESCRPSRPVPVFHIHGTADPLVPFGGGTTPRGLLYPGVPDVISLFRKRNECGAGDKVIPSAGAVRCTSRDKCRGDGEVALCVVEGMGHCWPGAPDCPVGSEDKPFRASDALWEFFFRHRLP